MRIIREVFNTTFADTAAAIRMTFKNIFCPSEGARHASRKQNNKITT